MSVCKFPMERETEGLTSGGLVNISQCSGCQPSGMNPATMTDLAANMSSLKHGWEEMGSVSAYKTSGKNCLQHASLCIS